MDKTEVVERLKEMAADLQELGFILTNHEEQDAYEILNDAADLVNEAADTIDVGEE